MRASRPLPTASRAVRRLVPAASALLSITLISACSSGTTKSTSSSSATTGSSTAAAAASAPTSATLIAAYTGAVETLDPQQISYGQTSFLDAPLYEALVTYDSNNQLVPGLASTYSLSPTADSVSVTLRSGVKFHSGNTLSATDVEFSLNRLVGLGTGIGNLLADYKSVTIADPAHLTINLKAPDSLFLGELSKAYILDSATVMAHAGSDQGQSWLATNDAGTGPYQLAPGTTDGGNIVVNRFAGYWNFSPRRPASVVFKRIDESSTQREALLAGDITYANNLSQSDANSLSGASVKEANLPVINQQYVYFNTTTGPTANVLVRRALQMAFDYQGALKKILAGVGQVAAGPLPLGMPCEATFAPFSQNLTAAKALLAQAGYSHLTLTMRYQPEITEQAQEAVLFQSDLSSIGVTLNLVPITFADYLKTLGSNSTIPQMMLLADNPQIPNVGSFLTQFYGPDSQGSNRSGFSDPHVDALLEAAASTNDPTAQCQDYEQAQKIIYDAATAVDLFTIPWPLGYSAKLAGVVVSPVVTPVSMATVTIP